VAREVGVSQATVSYVLNNDIRQSISPETRTKVLEVATDLGINRFAPARLLRSGKSNCAGMLAGICGRGCRLSACGELSQGRAAIEYSLIWQIGFRPIGAIYLPISRQRGPWLIDETDTAASQKSLPISSRP